MSAWNTNRSQNLQGLIDLLGPVPTGIDITAEVVLGLKIKVIADVTTTMITLVAMLTNPITAAGAGPMMLIKKRLLNAAVDIAVEQVLNQVLPMVIEPLAEQLPGLVMAALDSPIVESTVGDVDEFAADLQALEQAQQDMDLHADDIETLTERLITDLSTLNIGGD